MPQTSPTNASADLVPASFGRRVLALFVDPPVISSLIDTSATVFVSGIGNDSVVVEMIDVDGTAQTLTQIATTEPNRVLVVVPRNNTAGAYDIRVTTEFGCSDRRNAARSRSSTA